MYAIVPQLFWKKRNFCALTFSSNFCRFGERLSHLNLESITQKIIIIKKIKNICVYKKFCEGLWTQQWIDDDAILLLIKWLCHWALLGSLRIISDQCLYGLLLCRSKKKHRMRIMDLCINTCWHSNNGNFYEIIFLILFCCKTSINQVKGIISEVLQISK